MSDDDRIWTNAMVLAARDDEIDALEEKLARADARIAELVDLLTECRDCVVADINYTQAQSFHEPAAIDYLHALLLRVDAALAKAGADE